MTLNSIRHLSNILAREKLAGRSVSEKFRQLQKTGAINRGDRAAAHVFDVVNSYRPVSEIKNPRVVLALSKKAKH